MTFGGDIAISGDKYFAVVGTGTSCLTGNRRFEANRSIHSILRQLHSDIVPLI